MDTPNIVEVKNARTAIEQAKMSDDMVAVLMDGKYYVVHSDEAEQFRADSKEFAYLCLHKGQIVSVPVND
jgi:hypothetical protein